MRNNKERIKAEAKEKAPRRMSIGKRIAIIATIAFSVLAMTLVGAFSFAYFSKKDIYDAYMGGNVQLLFEKLTKDEANTANGSLYKYQLYLHTQNGGTADTFQYDASAEWGSERNPYIISEIKHLYNLSELQNVGFFKKEYVDKNTYDAEGNYTGGNKIPYFRVCNETNGQPVAIMGGDVAIETIGTEELPFIGSIQGAFATGTCDITTASGTKQSEVSAIHGVQMIADDDSVDVGLFGHITCLGDPTTADETTGEFAGYASVVSNLLLSDVKVKVQRTTFTQWISEKVDHIFSYTALEEYDSANNTTLAAGVHHETNHLGILAGHVTYSNVELISVYYSANDIVAIDLNDTRAGTDPTESNYHSDTGIIGLIDELNPEVPLNEDDTLKVGYLKKNSGIGSEVTGGSLGGGGGDMSGKLPGYMLANTIYTLYSYQGTKDEGDTTEYPEGTTAYPDTNGTITISDARNENGEMLCQESVNGDYTYYYFWDRIFTFAVSTTSQATDKDVIEPTWGNGIENNKFSVGADNDASWQQNNEQGAFAVTAYLRKVPIQNFEPDPNKKYYVFSAMGEQVFLLNLSEVSQERDGWGDNKYDTSGFVKDYADYDVIDTLWDDSAQWPNYLGTDTKYSQEDIDALWNDMDPTNANANVVAINLGSAEHLDELLQSYEIDFTKTADATYSLGHTITTETGSTKNNLYFVYRNFLGFLYPGYNMYCAPNTNGVSSLQGSTTNFIITPVTSIGEGAETTNAFTISSTIIGASDTEVTRYLAQGDLSGTPIYTAGENPTTTFFLYELVTSQVIDFGRVTYDPVEGTTTNVDLSPDQYVFFANSAHSNGDATDDYTYTLKNFTELNGLLWQDGKGHALGTPDAAGALAKKFTMKEAINFGVSLNLDFSDLGLPWNLGQLNSQGLLTAQVGNPTSTAIIPKGCVAFRIDKAEGDKKIRVIVAVPTSEYYAGESDDEGNESLALHYRYMNVWHLSDAPTGLGAETFDAGDYLDRFAIPNSRPYNPKTPIADVEHIKVKADINGDGVVDDARCYLNGDRVLVAYEFTITAEMGTGIFILGTTGYRSNVYADQDDGFLGSGGNFVATPMEIVYFSADGVASEGQDGNNYSPAGTIDFVYDNGTTVLTVNKQGDAIGSDATTDEIIAKYQTAYYPSYSTLYFDNEANPPNSTEFVNINLAQIQIRRWLNTATTGKVPSTIDLKVTNDDKDYIQVNNTYFTTADVLNKIE